EIVNGDNQEGDWKTLLSQPLRAKVSNKAGRALSNVKVRWTALHSGSVSNSESTTNADGITETRWTTGENQTNRSQVRAQVIGKNGQAIQDLFVLFQYKHTRTHTYSLGIVEHGGEDYGNP